MSWAEVKAGQIIRVLSAATPVEKDGIKHSANIFSQWSQDQLRNIAEESPEEIDAIIEHLRNKENK